MGTGTNPEIGLSNEVKSESAIDVDRELVLSCKTGNLEAFEPLVKKYEKRMFNIAYRITGSYEDAGEITQDAFVSAYKNIQKFRGEARFITWLTAITINVSKNRLNQLKARRAHEPVSLDDPIETDDGQLIADPPSNGPTALEQLETRETKQVVQDCIEALEPEFREVIVLRDMQEFSYEEIADMLKLRAGTVKSRLFRARDAVKECLKRAMGKL